jgi:hypothetical protein
MIAVLTDPGTGGTFLTWTLHYLSGQNQYYAAKQKKQIEVISDPVLKTNAHGFRPNQAGDLSKFKDLFQDLSNRNNNLDVLYFHNFSDCDRTSTGTTAIAIDAVSKKSKKIICLTISKKNSLYQCYYNARAPLTQMFSNQQQQHNHFIQTYFKDSEQKWEQLNLNNIWDDREFLALNYNPVDAIKITDVHNFNFDHYFLAAEDLWNMFDQTVIQLFDYLEIQIDRTRWENWINVYSRWKKIHYQQLKFDLYFETIIDYILSGKNIDLTDFNLDILQESAIQHTLIYKHNLNLKTWQLEKFQSTQQLHSLLEPNQHQIN